MNRDIFDMKPLHFSYPDFFPDFFFSVTVCAIRLNMHESFLHRLPFDKTGFRVCLHFYYYSPAERSWLSISHCLSAEILDAQTQGTKTKTFCGLHLLLKYGA